MRKLVAIILSTIALAFTVHQTVFAAGLSIRLEQPKTPTNQQEFDITFVTLDQTGRDVTVTCYKKGPYDAGYVSFGTAQTLTAGGNTGVCPVTSSILNTTGDYSFQAIATAGSDSASDTVSMHFNSEGPGDPTNYSKERVNFCDYKIKFHTADDSGKTVKVEVYRSENKTFSADNGSRVDTITLGSNQDGQSTTTPPSCDKNYYFAIRAFDTAGNGSHLVGDSETVTTMTTTVPSAKPTQGGAIALTTPGAGSVLGKEITAADEGKVLGETTPAATQKTPTTFTGFLKKNGILVFGILLLVIGCIGLYVSKKKNHA